MTASPAVCRPSARDLVVIGIAVDLVMLSDLLIAPLHDLHSQGVPHLLVRVRDGIGLVGPLVIPGVTSCLGKH